MKNNFNDTFIIWVNVFVAFILIIGYQKLGESFKFIVAPYVFYLIWSRDARFFPALVVHIIPGSTITFLILISCMMLAIYNMKYFRLHRLHWLIIISLLPLPLFLYMTYVRIFIMHNGFIEVVIPLMMYLGIFSFYYGILISGKMTVKIWRSLYLVLFLSFLLRYLPVFDYTVRSVFFSIPFYLLIILFLIFSINKKKPLRKYEKWIALTVLLLTLSGIITLSFTLLIGSLLNFILLLLYFRNSNDKLIFFTKPSRLLLVIILFTVFVINEGKSYYSKYHYYGPEMIFSSNSMDYFKFKIYGDRAPLWAGGLEYLIKNKIVWPPYDPPEYYTVNEKGIGKLTEIPIHNLILELFRHYGFIIGGFVFVIYLFELSLASRVLLKRNHNAYTVFFSSTAISTGFIGAMDGQYPLIGTFSFLLLGIVGVSYGISLLTD